MQLTRHDVETPEYTIPVLELLPDGPAANPPAVILCPGAGGNKEQVLENMVHLTLRGFATLSLDGPELGERRTERGIPRAPTEGPAAHIRWFEIGVQYARDFTAVLTWWLAAGRVDPERLGAWGRSFGANCLYYALQDERRVRAAVAVIGTPNNIETLRRRLIALPERGPEPTPEMWRQIRERFGPLTAIENADKLAHLPLLALSGGQDTVMPLEAMQPFVEKMHTIGQPKAPFVHHIHPDAAHTWTHKMEAEWIDWFEKHLRHA